MIPGQEIDEALLDRSGEKILKLAKEKPGWLLKAIELRQTEISIMVLGLSRISSQYRSEELEFEKNLGNLLKKKDGNNENRNREN